MPRRRLREDTKRMRGMSGLISAFRTIAAALMLVALAALWQSAPAQQPNSVNPTTSAVKEDQLLQQLKTIQGRGSIPDTKTYVIEQPEGRDWRHFHEVTL